MVRPASSSSLPRFVRSKRPSVPSRRGRDGRRGRMIASVHIANVGARSTWSVVRRAPKPTEVRGLRKANVAITAPLSAALLGKPDFGRVALVAFWDDDEALDGFLAGHPMARRLAGGWHARLA